MKRIIFAVLLPFIFIIASCTQLLYFDSAPKTNTEAVKRILQKSHDLKGVYRLKISYLDSVPDGFKSDKYNNYFGPALKNNTNDTVQYLSSLLFGSRYLEITENNGICRFLNFECLNKKVFNQFFSNGKRIIHDKDDSISVSASFKNDSIKLSIHNFAEKMKPSNDTTLSYRAWSRGELICFVKGEKSSFPDSIDLNDNTNNFAYLTAIHDQLYFVQKDTSDGKVRYNISNFILEKNGFIIRILNRFGTTQNVLDSLHVKHENDLIHFDETQLESLFISGLASNEIIANRIDGFPILSEDSGMDSLKIKYLFAIGGGILLLILYLFFRAKKT